MKKLISLSFLLFLIGYGKEIQWTVKAGIKFIEEIFLFILFPISFLIDNLGIYFILLSFVLNVLIYLFLGIYFNKKIVSKKARYSYYIFFIVILVINFYFFGWHFIGYRIDHCNVY